MIFICNHSNGDLFRHEDSMLSLHVKILCFEHMQAYLVFYWCLYNKKYLFPRLYFIYLESRILPPTRCLSSRINVLLEKQR